MIARSRRRRTSVPAVFRSPPPFSALGKICLLIELEVEKGPTLLEYLIATARESVEAKFISAGMPMTQPRAKELERLIDDHVRLYKVNLAVNAKRLTPKPRSRRNWQEPLAVLLVYSHFVSCLNHARTVDESSIYVQVASTFGPGIDVADVKRLVRICRRTPPDKLPLLEACIPEGRGLMIENFPLWATTARH